MFDWLTKHLGSFSAPVDATTTFHYDAVDDKVHFETREDVEPLIELNKAQYNNFDERSRWGDRFVTGTVARLPLWLGLELQRKGILDDSEKLAKWLDDPANSGWRTRPGRVSKRRPRR